MENALVLVCLHSVVERGVGGDDNENFGGKSQRSAGWENGVLLAGSFLWLCVVRGDSPMLRVGYLHFFLASRGDDAAAVCNVRC